MSEEDLAVMLQPRCGDGDEKKDESGHKRSKRWARLGNTVWPADLMPIKISVKNGARGFSVDQVEEVALECARVSIIIMKNNIYSILYKVLSPSLNTNISTNLFEHHKLLCIFSYGRSQRVSLSN